MIKLNMLRLEQLANSVCPFWPVIKMGRESLLNSLWEQEIFSLLKKDQTGTGTHQASRSVGAM
jgi:hypothetical protein